MGVGRRRTRAGRTAAPLGAAAGREEEVVVEMGSWEEEEVPPLVRGGMEGSSLVVVVAIFSGEEREEREEGSSEGGRSRVEIEVKGLQQAREGDRESAQESNIYIRREGDPLLVEIESVFELLPKLKMLVVVVSFVRFNSCRGLEGLDDIEQFSKVGSMLDFDGSGVEVIQGRWWLGIERRRTRKGREEGESRESSRRGRAGDSRSFGSFEI